LAISILESQDCLLADCFIGLVHLGAEIKKLPKNDYHSFRQQTITIFNRRFAEFDDNTYILYFILHPRYTGKVENMQKLSVFYLANSKKKLSYFSSNIKILYEALSNINFYENDYDYNKEPCNEERLANEVRLINEKKLANEERLANEQRLVNERRHLNKEKLANEALLEEKIFKIEELLNLDAADFTNNLAEIIVNTNLEFSDKANIFVQDNNTENNKEDWDPKKEVDALLN
ncbi:16000_t:CDS:2, partial [Racocetra fulgida]